MVVVSLLTRGRVPADVGRTMLRLHAPESLGLSVADRSSPVRHRSAHRPAGSAQRCRAAAQDPVTGLRP